MLMIVYVLDCELIRKERVSDVCGLIVSKGRIRNEFL